MHVAPLLVALALAGASGERPTPIAVFPIKSVDVKGFDKAKLAKFNEFIDTVVSSHGIPTVPRSELRRVLREEQRESFNECYDESCQIELGKAVAAQKILAATWSRLGDTCVLALKLHDLKSELTEFSTTQEVKCTEAGLKRAITQAGLELYGHVSSDPDARGATNISEFSPVAQGKNIENPVVDKNGYLLVVSKPAGARVFINGVERGQTPYQDEMMVGEYVVIVTAGALYEPARQRVRLTAKGVKLKMNLTPNFGVLRVESTPPGAAIDLDGEPTGQFTPHTFPNKKSGRYTVSVTHPLYLSGTKKVRIGKGKTTLVSVSLTPNFGSLAVASQPAGVEVFVDGVSTGQKTPTVLEQVADGTHQIEVKNETWTAPAKTVTVRKGKRAAVSLMLDGRFGTLKVTATVRDMKGTAPAQAAVRIDGKDLEGRTPIKQRVLVGAHEVELVLDGALPYRRTVTIEEDKSVTIDALLNRLTEEQVAAMERRARNDALLIERKSEEESRASTRTVALWTGAVSGVALIGGGILIGLAHDAASRANSAATVAELEDARNFGQTSQTTGWIAASVGGVALVTAVVLYLANLESRDSNYEF